MCATAPAKIARVDMLRVNINFNNAGSICLMCTCREPWCTQQWEKVQREKCSLAVKYHRHSSLMFPTETAYPLCSLRIFMKFVHVREIL
jgi:hypothetical protein